MSGTVHGLPGFCVGSTCPSFYRRFVGHQSWPLHDPTHPAHDPELLARQFDPLREVYTAVDRAIAEILDDAGDALVVVMSAHGMGSFYGAQFMLRDIAVGLGAAAWPAAPANQARALSAMETALRAAWQQLPFRLREHAWSVRRSLSRPDRNHDSAAALPALGVDTARSRCFPLSNGLGTGGIRLNLEGREPFGILKPGNDAAPTGSRAVGSSAGARIVATSARLGRVEGENTYGRTGEHRPEGIFIATSPWLQHKTLATPVSVLDFAPTLCALLGVDLPLADGRPILALTEPSGRLSSLRPVG